jgi:hypothetical protein
MGVEEEGGGGVGDRDHAGRRRGGGGGRVCLQSVVTPGAEEVEVNASGIGAVWALVATTSAEPDAFG